MSRLPSLLTKAKIETWLRSMLGTQIVGTAHKIELCPIANYLNEQTGKVAYVGSEIIQLIDLIVICDTQKPIKVQLDEFKIEPESLIENLTTAIDAGGERLVSASEVLDMLLNLDYDT